MHTIKIRIGKLETTLKFHDRKMMEEVWWALLKVGIWVVV